MLIIPVIIQADGEVLTLYLENSSYSNNESLTFIGNQTGNNQVYVVIRDASGKYTGILSDLRQNQGEFLTTPIPVTKLFNDIGIYNATAFTDEQREANGTTIKVEFDGVYVTSEFITSTNLDNISLTITTDQPTYLAGNTITISGQINHNATTSPTISLYSPTHGMLETIHNVTMNNHQYTASINTNQDTLLSYSGNYTLTAQYGNQTASTIFYYDTTQSNNSQEQYFIPDDQYLILSNQQINQWTNQITQWENAQNRTDGKTELYESKLERAVTNNNTGQIQTYIERIGHTMALSSLYDELIECLTEQLELLS